MINPTHLDTDEKYFADKEHFSVSKYKQFMRCELQGMQDFGTPSEAMKIGSFVDSYVSGTLDEFIKNNPDIISTRGATKGSLKSAFKKAEEICEFIDNDTTIQMFLGGDCQTVVTGEIEGVPFRAKLDIYSEGIAINDLKVMQSITDRSGNYYDFITAWRYDIQMAVYQELIYQNTGDKLPCFIVVVTKETPINSAIIQIDQHTLDLALQEVKDNVRHYYEVWKGIEGVKGCDKCNTCISTRLTTPIITLETLQGGVYDEN